MFSKRSYTLSSAGRPRRSRSAQDATSPLWWGSAADAVVHDGLADILPALVGGCRQLHNLQALLSDCEDPVSGLLDTVGSPSGKRQRSTVWRRVWRPSSITNPALTSSAWFHGLENHSSSSRVVRCRTLVTSILRRRVGIVRLRWTNTSAMYIIDTNRSRRVVWCQRGGAMARFRELLMA